MKTLLLIGCVAMATSTALSYWAPTSVEQLTAESDCVVIGTVKRLVPDTNTFRVLVTMDELSVLKGEKHGRGTVTVEAPFTLNNCAVFMVNGKRQVSLDSFTMHETCAVFLKLPLDRGPGLRLVQDSDGKFVIDEGLQSATRGVRMTAPDSLPLKEFISNVTSRKQIETTSMLPATAPHVAPR